MTCTHRNRPHEARITDQKYCGALADEYRLVRRLPPHNPEHWLARLCPRHLAYYTAVCRWEVRTAPRLEVVR